MHYGYSITVFYILPNRQSFEHSTNFKFAQISAAFLARRSPKFISRIRTLGRIDSSQKNWKIPLRWKLPGRNLKVVFYIRRMTIRKCFVSALRQAKLRKVRTYQPGGSAIKRERHKSYSPYVFHWDKLYFRVLCSFRLKLKERNTQPATKMGERKKNWTRKLPDFGLGNEYSDEPKRMRKPSQQGQQLTHV